MLGNVKPFIPALSEDGKDRYSAFYCGLCRSLGKNHGIFSRFMRRTERCCCTFCLVDWRSW